jgi:hypothetical protein
MRSMERGGGAGGPGGTLSSIVYIIDAKAGVGADTERSEARKFCRARIQENCR